MTHCPATNKSCSTPQTCHNRSDCRLIDAGHLRADKMPFIAASFVRAAPVDPNYEGPMFEKAHDNIARPDHYACYPIEPITFIMMNDLPFCAGNVVKYVCRAGRKSKDPREDIRKAMRYCQMWIEMLDREEAGTDGDVIGRPL